jgi:hypothetical protein
MEHQKRGDIEGYEKEVEIAQDAAAKTIKIVRSFAQA